MNRLPKTEEGNNESRSDHVARRIAMRTLLPAIATSVLMLVIGIVAAVYLRNQQQETTKLLTVDLASIRVAEDLAVAVRQAEIRIHRFVRTGDASNLLELPSLERQSSRLLQELGRLSRSDGERAILDKLAEVHPRLWTAMMAEDRLEFANRAARYDLADTMIRQLNAYVATKNTLVEQAAARNAEISNRLAISLLLLGVLGSLLGLVLGALIAQRIRRTIVELSLSIRDTTGKLDEALEPITLSGSHGIDNLNEALQHVSEKVGAVVERLAISQRDHLRAEQLASLGRVSAGLAHELRNPVASMKLLVQSALERGKPLADRQLTVVHDEIQRLERLTRSFLDFARPPSLERSQFDLIKVYHQKLVLISGRLKLKHLQVESTLADERLLVEADQGQMRQLLLNLLLNAIDASPEAGTIHVVLRRTGSPTDVDLARSDQGPTQDARWVLLEVVDEGPGVTAESKDALFEPFFSTKQEGVGLGLAISKRIVEAHAGYIHVTNREEGGARFRVLLPIADDASTIMGIDTPRQDVNQ